ncbi:MAG: hypothetical protein A3K19_19295 [Lentisphaerae bacterium RIFOXYB12_FULL_65_16]|nr:MAG: hypothetical protein A3K18_06140 [Lentisphaerae bacterium RIFOXYA12_64_32]OGV84677.1 MAG: hypothetical protein A3K19_19295 [Lentisphaerae bacterium RIFOXYB12_FULL_65_16]
MRPRIFLIDEVDDRVETPSGSALLPDSDESVPRAVGLCPACLNVSGLPPYDILVHGSDDLLAMDLTVKAFIPLGPPLIAALPYAERLAHALTGCTCVRVGYSDWNQDRDLRGGERFEKGPLLGGLYVTGTCTDATTAGGRPVRCCSACGCLRPPGWFDRAAKQRVFPVCSAWDGCDLFVLEGMSQELGTVLTEAGRQKMAQLGFNNLRLNELEWSN